MNWIKKTGAETSAPTAAPAEEEKSGEAPVQPAPQKSADKTVLNVIRPLPTRKYNSLVRLYGRFLGPVEAIECSVNGSPWQRIELPVEETDDTSKKFEALINSFLVPNGQNSVRVRALDRESRVLREEMQTFQVDNTSEVAEQVSAHWRSLPDAPFILQAPLNSGMFPYDTCPVKPWFYREDALAQIPTIMKKHELEESCREHLENFVNNGFIHLDRFIPDDLIDAVNKDIEALIEKGEADPQMRIRGFHLQSVPGFRLWTFPGLIKIASALFDCLALPSQSLTFVYGSQQNVHQDTIHLTPFPEGFMCGVWIALEDIHPDAGPVFYHPGSHRLDVLYLSSLGISAEERARLMESDVYTPKLKAALEKQYTEKVAYTPKKGSVLIWHPQLAHGGSPRKREELTRKSIVFHYFGKCAVRYSETHGGNLHSYDVENDTYQL